MATTGPIRTTGHPQSPPAHVMARQAPLSALGCRTMPWLHVISLIFRGGQTRSSSPWGKLSSSANDSTVCCAIPSLSTITESMAAAVARWSAVPAGRLRWRRCRQAALHGGAARIFTVEGAPPPSQVPCKVVSPQNGVSIAAAGLPSGIVALVSSPPAGAAVITFGQFRYCHAPPTRASSVVREMLPSIGAATAPLTRIEWAVVL